MAKIEFEPGTPDEIKEIIQAAMGTQRRLRFFYGNRETGRDWLEENDTQGLVRFYGGKWGSGEIMKRPMLMKNNRSAAGLSILTNSIVRITENRKTLYQHSHYHLPTFTIVKGSIPHLPFEVLANGETEARFETKEKAERFIEFLRGNRNNR